jgi:DNA-directed RNA polymerase sigma subunit (sigma70/sigma32)
MTTPNLKNYYEEDIIKKNYGLAVQVARRFGQTAAYSTDDLIQLALIGLLKASRSFDPNKNFKFSTYGSICARNEILKFIQKNKPMTSRYSEGAYELPNEIWEVVPDTLDDMEMTVIEMKSQGYSNAETAKELNITKSQLKPVIISAYNKIRRANA